MLVRLIHSSPGLHNITKKGERDPRVILEIIHNFRIGPAPKVHKWSRHVPVEQCHYWSDVRFSKLIEYCPVVPYTVFI